ncbi:hypothetical protein LCS82_07905 [Vibrio harveyi]|uniref:hypothetical protein n=1 Tax=Vibrio harveyi TaxID=669 RepID=UPI003BB563AB
MHVNTGNIQMNSVPTQSLAQMSVYSQLLQTGFLDWQDLAEKNVGFDFSLVSSSVKKQVEFLMELVSMGACTHPILLDLFLDHDFTDPLKTKRILDCTVRSVSRYCSQLFDNTKRSVMLPEYADHVPIFPIAMDLRVGECEFTHDIKESFYGARFDSQAINWINIDTTYLSEPFVVWLNRFLETLEFKRDSFEFGTSTLQRNSEMAYGELCPRKGDLYPERLGEIYQYLIGIEESNYDLEVAFKLLVKATNLKNAKKRKKDEYKTEILSNDNYCGYLEDYDQLKRFVSSMYIPELLECKETSYKNKAFWQSLSELSLFDSLTNLFNSVPTPSNELEEKLQAYLLGIKPSIRLIRDEYVCHYDENCLGHEFFVSLVSDKTKEYINEVVDEEAQSNMQEGVSSWGYIDKTKDVLPFIKYRAWLDGVLETLMKITEPLDTIEIGAD